MLIATEIKRRLPSEVSRLEALAAEFSDFKNENTFVAQAEYEALMDAKSVKSGHQLDNGKAIVFYLDFVLPPNNVNIGGLEYVFENDGPGSEAYGRVREFREGKVPIVPF